MNVLSLKSINLINCLHYCDFCFQHYCDISTTEIPSLLSQLDSSEAPSNTDAVDDSLGDSFTPQVGS